MKHRQLAIFKDINNQLINYCSIHLTTACVLPI